MVFASCNDQDRPQPLWKPILSHHPDVFIWGGDNIYADTADLEKMAKDYESVSNNPDYVALKNTTEIIGTWDDHDYGKNDAGREWIRKGAKTLLLNFLEISNDAPIRNRAGVYDATTLQKEGGSVKVVLLDTRTFRTALKSSKDPDRRYDAWDVADGGTLLGEDQWQWLQNELNDDTANFTVIVSSIQFLSDRHGWEKWANHPGEVARMYAILQNAKAKNILFLSGDRHMAEVSVNRNPGLKYPLVDFTSSGLTHTWIDSATEANPYRVSNVVKKLNFGVLLFDFRNNAVTFQIRGEDNFLYDEFVQQY